VPHGLPTRQHRHRGPKVVPLVRGVRRLPRIIDAAEAAGFSVNDLSVTEPTLESVFINLTGKDLRE
jgi:hypothetical protein